MSRIRPIFLEILSTNTGSMKMKPYKSMRAFCESERFELDGRATNQNSILGRRVTQNKGCRGIKGPL